ncbi:MAG: Xaa-Pro peptidase family protein [bacterium]|nr:Xaa-Pro peptidase family protein [bacterium]
MDRINKLQKILSRKKLDGLLISNIINVQYLSGFTGSSADVLLTAKENYFITDSRYLEQTQKEIKNGFVLVREEKGLIKTLKKLLQKQGLKNLGLETNSLTYDQYQELLNELSFIELIPTYGLVQKLRLIKDEDEIHKIKHACQIAEDAFKVLLPFIKEGLSEHDLAIELEYLIKKKGGEIAFETIVLSGRHSSLPHGKPSHKKLALGDFILFDWGAKYKGYNCDLSRTLLLGNPTHRQKLVYSTVKNAQEEALENLNPGIKFAQLNKIATERIGKNGLKRFFRHSLGHGVGLEVHELPKIGHSSKGTLKSGMVITIEPGVYIPSFGGVRIEDTVLITDKGHKVLTDRVSKELIVI